MITVTSDMLAMKGSLTADLATATRRPTRRSQVRRHVLTPRSAQRRLEPEARIRGAQTPNARWVGGICEGLRRAEGFGGVEACGPRPAG